MNMTPSSFDDIYLPRRAFIRWVDDDEKGSIASAERQYEFIQDDTRYDKVPYDFFIACKQRDVVGRFRRLVALVQDNVAQAFYDFGLVFRKGVPSFVIKYILKNGEEESTSFHSFQSQERLIISKFYKSKFNPEREGYKMTPELLELEITIRRILEKHENLKDELK